MTVVESLKSPVRYHIEEQGNNVHVFLNRPLSRLDLGTLTEIFRAAEKPLGYSSNPPMHATPLSAPPTPKKMQGFSENQSASTLTKLSKSLFSLGSSLSDVTTTTGNQSGKKETSGPILFYDKDKPHYGFTNFSDHPIEYKGEKYATSEHLFQSLKFLDSNPWIAALIRLSTRPREAFDLAHQYNSYVRSDWRVVNIQMMDEVLWHKFTQHSALKQELLATGDAELIEASDLDAFWGWGADHKGRNELGKALMRLRAKLRHNPFTTK
ncbi:hypothetical protein AMATHDRAFT_150037 [Amanita thiersii Skay4041]|uniref:NADAR domain-containing protein n=1 Tax=Amanita thiersii Skay4041 TaxID=703135 RepID=A0A2A9NGE4_9AGAR|nr:hypothetical protein AMATHDRAFT_150037 [Amanita thiersii Skay4041]